MLEDIAELLQVDIYDLEDVLTQRSMVLRGEEIKSPLTIPQVCGFEDYFKNDRDKLVQISLHHSAMEERASLLPC